MSQIIFSRSRVTLSMMLSMALLAGCERGEGEAEAEAEVGESVSIELPAAEPGLEDPALGVPGLDGAGPEHPRAEEPDAEEPVHDARTLPTHETRINNIRFLSLRNRTESSEPAERFGDERDVLRAGTCEVTWTPIRMLEHIAANSPLYIPSDDLEITAVTERSIDAFWDEFVADNIGRRPLLYVHGYNVGFAKGCYRAARFSENLAIGRRLLLFSWPSDGSALNYMRDEADLSWSVNTLREVLLEMEQRFGRGNFDVFAHSLGARGVMLALSAMHDFHTATVPLVDRLILAAADIDADVFEQLLPRLRAQAHQITAYVSDNDSALALSRELHGYPRLGEASTHVVALQGVDVIDVSDLPLRRVTGHLYHLYNETAYRDIAQVLNERRPATQRRGLKNVDPTVPNFWRLLDTAHPGE
jgi:esterase/lipase superfamily enzyme